MTLSEVFHVALLALFDPGSVVPVRRPVLSADQAIHRRPALSRRYAEIGLDALLSAMPSGTWALAVCTPAANGSAGIKPFEPTRTHAWPVTHKPFMDNNLLVFTRIVTSVLLLLGRPERVRNILLCRVADCSRKQLACQSRRVNPQPCHALRQFRLGFARLCDPFTG
jgi:hypothetical protein